VARDKKPKTKPIRGSGENKKGKGKWPVQNDRRCGRDAERVSGYTREEDDDLFEKITGSRNEV